jgi:small subunit ribosomal protein S33
MASKFASIAPSRLKSLTRLRCSLFQTSYNPTNIRTGAKYLRARLRGPSMVKYYPPESELDIAKIMRQHPELGLVNEKEKVRLADVADKKKRGKGAPKKTKVKGM